MLERLERVLFSERIGLTEPKAVLQFNTVDEDLRNSFWNAIYTIYLEKFKEEGLFRSGQPTPYNSSLNSLIRTIYSDFYKKPVDTIPSQWSMKVEEIRKNFFSGDWKNVYNLIEFIPLHYRGYDISLNTKFRELCNKYMIRELSGYRFTGEWIIPITTEQELSAVTAVQDISFKGAKQHFENAISLFSRRENPDYRNTIKEAISGVEQICRELTGESTLDKALKKLDTKVLINGQLKQGLEKIYHYTNGPDGIRHALMDDPNVGFDEAKFMLVTCSAFANYIAAKSYE